MNRNEYYIIGSFFPSLSSYKCNLLAFVADAYSYLTFSLNPPPPSLLFYPIVSTFFFFISPFRTFLSGFLFSASLPSCHHKVIINIIDPFFFIPSFLYHWSYNWGMPVHHFTNSTFSLLQLGECPVPSYSFSALSSFSFSHLFFSLVLLLCVWV